MRKTFKLACILATLAASLSCRIFTPATPPPTSTPPATSLPATIPPPASPTPPEISPLPPTPTTTPAPAGLNDHGPYVLFQARGIWISNPDGSFPTQLTALQSDYLDLRRAVSQDGSHLAMLVFGEKGPDLLQVDIPTGETKTLAHLFDIRPDEITANPTGSRAFTAYALMKYNSFAWQPGSGRLLAFMGAIDGPTSDLYTIDTQTGKITRLTNGPSQAVEPSWSPDGRYILHYGGSWVPPFGGAILGFTRLDGVWAVRIPDGDVISQPKPKSLSPNFVDWLDGTHYVTYDSDEKCFSQNLRSVDVVTGKSAPIMALSFYYRVARSPENGAYLFAGAPGCSNSPGEGVFLLPAGETTPIKLLDKRAYEINWLPESQVFQAYPEALFTADGKTRYDPPLYDHSFQPAISRLGFQAWEVIENQQGRVVVKSPGGEWKTILTGLVDELIWDPTDGNTLLIALQDGSLYSASAPDFSPRLTGSLGGRVSQAIWLP